MPVDLARRDGVELIRTGSWPISTGRWDASRDDLAAAVAAMSCPAVRLPVLKIGHTDDRFVPGDGEPAIGRVENLRLADDGHSLVGDYVGVPGWINDVMASAWPDRSVEGTYNFECQIGHTHPFVLTGVALLGVTPPGVGTLRSLDDVQRTFGLAAAAPAGGVRVAATVSSHMRNNPQAAAGEDAMPSPEPSLFDRVRAAWNASAPHRQWIVEARADHVVVMDDSDRSLIRVPFTADGEAITFGAPEVVRVEYVAASADVPAEPAAVFASRAESRPDPRGEVEPPLFLPPTDEPAEPVDAPAAGAAPETPAAEPDQPTTEEDPVSDLTTGVRQRLGLPDDADEATVLAKLDEKLTAPTPKPEPAPEPEPLTATESEPALVSAAAAPTAPPVDPALSQEVALLKQQVAAMSGQLASANAEKAAAIKASVLNEAQRLGKFRPADRAAWEANYDKAPEVCASVLDSIAAGSAVPVASMGHTGPAEAASDADADWDRFERELYGPADASKGA